MECPQDEPDDYAVPSELYRLAITVVEDLLAERTPDVTAHLEAIARTAERERLGPSTAAIADAARRRDIPVRRVGGLSMLRLGYGCHRRLVSAAMTEQTSAIGVDIAADKMLTKMLMTRAGIAVPGGVVARTEVEAAITAGASPSASGPLPRLARPTAARQQDQAPARSSSRPSFPARITVCSSWTAASPRLPSSVRPA
jgi:cyanophycin synthetase